MNKLKKVMNKAMHSNVARKGVQLAVLASTLVAAGAAKATGELDASTATAGITTATGYATTILTAGLALGVVFLVGRVLRRGMRSAG
ncbi:MAG: hypothetical protein ABIT37_10630 [Luteolibacter sp.]